VNLVGVYDGLCHSSTEASMGRPPRHWRETWMRRVVPEGKDHVWRELPSIRLGGRMSHMLSLMMSEEGSDEWSAVEG